jgi:5-methylcytosine-specific restriction endonuclease McrA
MKNKRNDEAVCRLNRQHGEAVKAAASLLAQAGRRTPKRGGNGIPSAPLRTGPCPYERQPSMKSTPNAATVWKQLEDVAVPKLRLSLIERAVYSHLLRHSRLEGRVRYRFSIASVARGICFTREPVRRAVRRLVDHGALRLIGRSREGHVVEVRVPGEIRASRFEAAAKNARRKPGAAGLEEIDFMQTKELRRAIHAREGARCFYCLRRLVATTRCIDHVVPQAHSRRNSYRNLVSACLECNSQKGEKPAEGFLRWLYRERRLTGGELSGRVRALDALAAGRIRPEMKKQGSKEARRQGSKEVRK